MNNKEIAEKIVKGYPCTDANMEFLGAEIISALDQAEQRGREKGLEEVAKVVDRWHIRKGGFTSLAFDIRALSRAEDGGKK